MVNKHVSTEMETLATVIPGSSLIILMNCKFIDRTGQVVKLMDDTIPTRLKTFPKHLKKTINQTEYNATLVCKNL